ncbi:hypothetical protein ACJRO7_021300 [Eucalyptus globulus]|uniref:Uncharacterized protein n=1 Tax=Eucalyptus globulus TaxID=34317 RepID=A0ABD3KK27_EUCGL
MAEELISRVAKLVDDFREGQKLRGAGRESSKLKKTVSFLQSIVPDAEKRILRDPWRIVAWLDHLKDAFYEAEDLLEEWPSKDEKLKKVIPSSSPSEKPHLRLEMSARAKKIKKRLEAIAADGRDLGLRECAVDVRVERRERLDSFVYEEEIIGREDDKSAIMNFFLDSDTDEHISVLSIWGRSGIGKTALARCLYEDDMVKKHFDLRIWVCVGDNDFHDLENELRKIRGRETTERADDMEQLRKYLLVIEDLWSLVPERWGSLKSLLMGGARGSKILIITDDGYIAHSTSTSPSYRLEALQTELSVNLLMRMACQEEEETRNPIKVDIGRRIVKMCYGIPLAIRMIGSLLFFKNTEAEWSNFEDETPEFSADSRNLSSILELSYNHLPCHLKQCFAFCSFFPGDWVIDKQTLTSLWMAEGFILPIDNGDWDMENIAHDYFMDLLRRNFFQDCVKDELGNVTSCRMHHLVHDLACHVASTEYATIYHLRSYPEE